MEQYRIDVLEAAAARPCITTSEVATAIDATPAQVAPILSWLCRGGYIARLDSVHNGQRGWDERAWSVTREGHQKLASLPVAH
jgi:DNA-binding MarR family transcriptional regulator